MRRVINKNLTEDEILRAAELLARRRRRRAQALRDDRAADRDRRRRARDRRPRAQDPRAGSRAASAASRCRSTRSSRSRGRRCSGSRWLDPKTLRERAQLLRRAAQRIPGATRRRRVAARGLLADPAVARRSPAGAAADRGARERRRVLAGLQDGGARRRRRRLSLARRVRAAPLCARRDRCRGTSSTTASTSATCSPSGARRCSSARRRRATSRPATPAARAEAVARRGDRNRRRLAEIDRIARALAAPHGARLRQRVFTAGRAGVLRVARAHARAELRGALRGQGGGDEGARRRLGTPRRLARDRGGARPWRGAARRPERCRGGDRAAARHRTAGRCRSPTPPTSRSRSWSPRTAADRLSAAARRARGVDLVRDQQRAGGEHAAERGRRSSRCGRSRPLWIAKMRQITACVTCIASAVTMVTVGRQVGRDEAQPAHRAQNPGQTRSP